MKAGAVRTVGISAVHCAGERIPESENVGRASYTRRVGGCSRAQSSRRAFESTCDGPRWSSRSCVKLGSVAAAAMATGATRTRVQFLQPRALAATSSDELTGSSSSGCITSDTACCRRSWRFGPACCERALRSLSAAHPACSRVGDVAGVVQNVLCMACGARTEPAVAPIPPLARASWPQRQRPPRRHPRPGPLCT